MTSPLSAVDRASPKVQAEEGYLGPAEVVADERPGLWVRLPEGEPVAVTPAFTFPYTPQPGDVLLVVTGARTFAIGVIAGAGVSALEFPADVEIRSLSGTLSLHGAQGVAVEGAEVTLRGETVRTFAERIQERADSAYRWVKGMLTVRAGESRRIVAGDDASQSKRAVILAKETVKLDGHQVQLGH